jgi:hypothetical protein
MQEQLITLETAKLAKKKGFGLPFDKSKYQLYYSTNDVDMIILYSSKSERVLSKPHVIKTCTQSILQKWLREVHNIEVYARSSVDLYNKKYWTTFLPNGCLENKNNTYEEALEVGLQEALKLI